MGPGGLDRRRQVGRIADASDADAGTRAGRLDEHRQPERGQPRQDAVGIGPPLGSRDQLVGADLEPGGEQHRLHVPLVHGRRRGEHPGTHVRDAGELEQPLDRPVLAPRPVQHREHDVDVVQEPDCRIGRAHVDPTVRGVTGEHHVRAGRVHGREPPVGDPQPLRLVALHDPPTLGRDPDGHHVVGRAVDRGQDAARADAGDRVLAAAPAEDHCHPDPPLLIHDPDPSAHQPVGCGGMADDDRSAAPDHLPRGPVGSEHRRGRRPTRARAGRAR